MSKHHRNRASQEAAPNVLTTEQTVQQPQEKIMEANMQDQMEPTKEVLEEVSGPTAKEMAAAEEANQLRALQLAAQAEAPPPEAAVPISDLAARGYDALHEAFRKHNENAAKKKDYIPPPRTERQMSALEEELEAGRKTQQRAEAQLAASRPVPPDGNKEGFTTPVYRPGNVVPDPTIPAKPGHGLGGNRQFGADAPESTRWPR